MAEEITLPLPAVDVLGAHLNLGVRRYPFEIPRTGGTAADREHVARQVWPELEAAGLARSGRIEPEVEDALYLMCSAEIAIAVAGLLDVRTGRRLAARVVATGEVGVLGVITDRGLRMEFMSPENLPEVAAGLLPQTPAGVGEGAWMPFERPSGAEPSAASTLAALTAQPKQRIGHFTVTSTDRRGRSDRLPGPVWFDTEHGRYVLHERPGADGDVLTCVPADHTRMAGLLADVLERLRAG